MWVVLKQVCGLTGPQKEQHDLVDVHVKIDVRTHGDVFVLLVVQVLRGLDQNQGDWSWKRAALKLGVTEEKSHISSVFVEASML